MKKLIGIVTILLLMLAGFMLFGCGAETIDASDCVELGEYKGLEYVPQSAEVTNDDYEAAIDQLVEANPQITEITDQKIADGDTVNIDYIGYVNGEALEQATAVGVDLTIGSNTYIEGFESGLIGKKPGDKVELNLSFPDPYTVNPDLSGQKVDFDVTINFIKKTKNASYDDEFVERISSGKYKTTEEYDEYLWDKLKKDKAAAAEKAKAEELWSQVISNCYINNYPDSLINDYVQNALDYYKKSASNSGQTFSEEYLKDNYNITTDTINDWAYEDIGEQLIVEAIASAENISIKDDEYAAEVEEYLQKMGFETAEEFTSVYNQTFEEYYGRDTIEYYLLYEKVIDMIMDNAVAVEEDKNEENNNQNNQ